MVSDMRQILISDEDYEFLKDLQHELNNQETDCQADPIYWSVMEYRKEAAPEGCGEAVIYDGDGVMTLEESIQYVDENIRYYNKDVQEQWEEVDKDLIGEVADFICDKMGTPGCSVVWQQEKQIISQETGAFITKRACQEYIKRFGYNHNRPHTYAMTAWRNFELERLLKILKTMKILEG